MGLSFIQNEYSFLLDVKRGDILASLYNVYIVSKVVFPSTKFPKTHFLPEYIVYELGSFLPVKVNLTATAIFYRHIKGNKKTKNIVNLNDWKNVSYSRHQKRI